MFGPRLPAFHDTKLRIGLLITPVLFVIGCGAAARTDQPEQPNAARADEGLPPRKDLPAGNAEAVDAPKPQVPRQVAAEPDAKAPIIPVADLIERVERSVVRLDVTLAGGTAIGSGFVADESGLVVTNYHVIEGALKAEATFNDRSKVKVLGILAFNRDKDIAVLKIDTRKKKRNALPLSAALPRKGDSVIALGAPKGLSFSVSKGTVAAIRDSREMGGALGKKGVVERHHLVQTDAAISQGNSGGPLVDERGGVVGINTFTRLEGQNLNFAVSAIDLAIELKKGMTAPLQAFKAMRFPERKVGGRREPAGEPIDADSIATTLEQYRLSWELGQRIRLGALANDVKLIEEDVKASERVIGAVKEGGPEVGEILRQYPYGKTRYTWLKGARAYVALQQERAARLRAEASFEELLLNDHLCPVPVLNAESAEVRDWGLMPGGVISKILEDKSFIASVKGEQMHFQKFDVLDVAVGKVFETSDLCIVAGTFPFPTADGPTILSLQPVDKKLLPPEFANRQERRTKLFQERDAMRDEDWKRTVAQSEKAIRLKVGFPEVGTVYEPATIIEVLEGNTATPNFPKRYRVETFEQVIPRQPPSEPLVAVHTRTVETDESKRWRAEQIREFNAKKAIYPALMLDSLMDELAQREDGDFLSSRKKQLKADLQRLQELAFERYGIRGDRIKVIPWSESEKQEVIDHLKRIAVQYGRIEQTAALELARIESRAEEEEKEKAPDLKRLKERLRLKSIVLEREKKNVAKVDRTVQVLLEREIAEIKKQIETAEAANSE
jgi:S1-C subfamily serine protease